MTGLEKDIDNLRVFLSHILTSRLCLSDQIKDAHQADKKSIPTLKEKDEMWKEIENALRKCITEIENAVNK